MPTKLSDKREVIKPEKILDQENSQLLQQIRDYLKEVIKTKTGITDVHAPGFTISFVNGTRTLTLTPDNGSFEYWVQGVKYTKTAADSVIIDDTEGIWYIYYVGSVLTASQVEWTIKDGDKAMISVVHWDATNNAAISVAFEVHGSDMPPNTHSYLHRTIGTNFVSGLGLVEGTGGDDGKVAMDGGELRDEDVHIDIVDGAGSDLFEQELGNTTVFAAAQIPVFYRSGATAWRKYTAGDYPFYDNSGADNVYYNSYSAPNWASTEATNSAKYVAIWIFGTNDQTEPIIAIMGQNESSTLNAAKAVDVLENLSFGYLPFEEMKVLYRLIFKSDGTHAHTEDMRSVANVPGGTYVPQPSPVSDEVYSASWDGVTALAPSKNAVYDKFESLSSLTLPTWPTAITAMTRDGNWHDVDISGTYGAKKHLVFLYLYSVDDAAGVTIALRPKGSASAYTFYSHQVANIVNQLSVQVQTDSNGVFQYNANAALTAGTGYAILAVLTP